MDFAQEVGDFRHFLDSVFDASRDALERTRRRGSRIRGNARRVSSRDDAWTRRERIGPTTTTTTSGTARVDAADAGDGARNRPAPSQVRDVRAGVVSSPEQVRTAVSALRGRRPRPLDDGADGLGG